MKVLLLGATGNLGSRLVPALLTHKHQVVAYVRTARKLESLLPETVYQQIQVVQGDATDVQAIKKAILDHNCDALVTAAGVAKMAFWASGELPGIFKAVATAVSEAGSDRGRPLRAWFLAGGSILNYADSEVMLSSYIPLFWEHRGNYQVIKDLPPNAIEWSILCPFNMAPESTDLSVPTKPSKPLTTAAGTLPLFQRGYLEYLPWIGRVLTLGSNVPRYATTLEQNAELIASDLENPQSPFIGKTVGVISETGSKSD